MTFNEEQNILKDIIEKDGRLDYEKIIQLPIKLKNYVYYANPIKIIKDEFLGNTSCEIKRPDYCKMTFSELCETCDLNNKQCINANFPDRFWLHEDSPYISLVINLYNNGIFDNEQDCIKWCSEHNDREVWDKVYSQIKDYIQ